MGIVTIMRYITVVIAWEDYIQSKNDQQMQRGINDPREVWIDGTLVATQEAIQYLNLLDDGTVVGVARFRGDADRLATIEDEIPEIISCTVTGGETWLAYIHYKPGELETAILERIDTEAISIDWPMRETADGLEVTLFGEDAALQHLIAGFPDEVDVTLERAGEYQSDMSDPAGQLTNRQQEILRTALTAGYYDIPRRTTQRDLAAELELSRGTIGDHLRRAEAKIIRSMIV
ncbi:bacterio-opsin activator-like protein [Halococcus morrhuae DSM 1307]|uniref:Bacterio-opsin activator-like protein n=1 Tax=Halococcus morrhuae DSM 1307 TaxID=931277 RepID=M0M9H9_HALMO|nr:helix-turn-helix domain-containing protein [Halococcus morrhuae]EMA41035.1 bacterio-opsin activator-like protein [Halococcus morrhuae DSM 1307]